MTNREPDQPAYDTMSDEQLVEAIQKNDDAALEFLIGKYKNLVRAKARYYFLIGADREDLIQEGMFGLFKAVRDYKPDHDTSFHVFAEVCVTRQIITAIKSATRQKHIPLNSYVSLNRPVFEEGTERTLMDMLVENIDGDPEALMIGREGRNNLRNQLQEALSPLERQVLGLYLRDKSYQEIAIELDKQVKSVDNALQRIKHKLEKFLQEM